MRNNFLLVAGLFLFIATGTANSAIVDMADVDGMGYFKDTETNLIWHDVDNFSNMSIDEIVSTISGTPFHLASKEEIIGMSGISAQTILYMGGIYDEDSQTTIAYGLGKEPFAGSDYGRMFLTGYSNAYSLSYMSADPDQSYTGYGGWVVSNSVPIPGAIWLLGSCMIGMVGLRKKIR